MVTLIPFVSNMHIYFYNDSMNAIQQQTHTYITQRLSVAVQRGNAASMLGTMKVDIEDEEFFFCISSVVLFYCNVSCFVDVELYYSFKTLYFYEGEIK